ncbi:MAG: NAD(P)-dependent oxidoreductase [Candidatus Avispirillum sp.]
MKTVFLDAATLGDDIDLSPVTSMGETVIYAHTSPAQVSGRIGDAETVIINEVKLNRDTVGEATNLRLVCIAATGCDNVDLEYMKSRGVAVCNVSGYSTDSVAQTILAMVLSLATHIREYNGWVRSGSYSAGSVPNRLEPVYHEISGKTWGVVGLGSIGRKVAAAAAAMGCRVIANKRVPVPDFECVDIDTLCKNSDIITLHTPLTEETRGLISRERIAMMKKDAILVNVARGAVCDETALCEAVKNGRLGAVGVDVYSQEPFPESSPYTKIMGLDNVLLTPHMAWGSFEARNRCLAEIAENIRSFESGGTRSRLV